MTVKMEKFMRKHCFAEVQIQYIVREHNKTCIYLTDGREIAMYPTIREYSPEENLTIRCFQPAKGFCACLIEEEEHPA